MESPEWRLYQIHNRFQDRWILFLPPVEGIFLAKIADTADGIVLGHGIDRSEVYDTIMVYVIAELKYRRPD